MSDLNETAQQREATITMWAFCGINEHGAPWVRLVRNREVLIQVHPDAARSLGLALIESGDAADQDAFMYSFWRNTYGKGHEEAVQMINALRRYRQARKDEARASMQPNKLVDPNG